MTKPSAGQVRILKVTAAQRQLDAAIRMSFAGEDALAITTISAAAYQILHDLLVKRGRKVLEDEWRTDMLGVARALVKNELPAEHLASFQSDAQLWPLIQMIAEQVRRMGPDKPISELSKSVHASIPWEAEREHWRRFKDISNYLKHADKDHQRSVAADEADPKHMILRACGLYLDLMGRLTEEMEVWSLHFLHIENDVGPPSSEMRRKMLEILRAAKPESRGRLALEMIAILKRDDSPSGPGEPAIR